MASRYSTGCVALLLLLGGMLLLGAQTPPHPRGNPIIFSGPKSDVVSSNLNELRSPTSPFLEMESTLKVPFELLGPGTSGDSASRPRRPPAQPESNRKAMKDILNSRAEEMFLDPKLHEGETDDDLYKTAADALDLSPNKPKNALERYYDRMDRALTNRAVGPDANSLGKDAHDLLNQNSKSPLTASRDLETQRNATDNKFRPLLPSEDGSSAARKGFFGERSTSADLDHGAASRPDNTFSGYREQKENRLDAFKRLLDGSSQARSGSLPTSGAYATTSSQPSPYASPMTFGSNYKSTSPTDTKSANSFTKSAGLIGAPGSPQGLPDYTANSTPRVGSPTQPPPKTPVSSFNLPKRRF